jgi:hypothetical protein
MPEDRRAWSLQTLTQVAAGRPLTPHLTIQTRPGWTPGLSTIVIRNDGESDALLPAQLNLAEGCDMAEGAGLYTRIGNSLVQRGRTLLHPNMETRAGWQRCGEGKTPSAEN